MMEITPAQARAARALLNLTQQDIAKLAGVSLSTLLAFELERREISSPSKLAIAAALEMAGVLLMASTHEHSAGVALKLGAAPKHRAARKRQTAR